MEDNGLNQNFILCLGSKYFLPSFCSKAIYIHIILNDSIWKGNPMVVLPHDRERHEEDCLLCHSDWIEILGYMVHYPIAIYALIHILQKFPAECYLCNNLLSNSSTILPKIGRLKLRISLIS